MEEEIYRCFMCDSLMQMEDDGVAVCPECGNEQVHFGAQSDLFYEAAKLRAEKLDFSGAAEIYRKIISNNPDDAMAYWGLVLCDYCVSYYSDRFRRYHPMCYRVVDGSLYENPNYLNAIEHMPISQRELYVEYAMDIDSCQMELKCEAERLRPYDSYISAVSSRSGAKNHNQEIAGDLYRRLTVEKGQNVFYPRESFVGLAKEDYAPLIYGALMTATTMYVVITRPSQLAAERIRRECARFVRKHPARNLVILLSGCGKPAMPPEMRGARVIDLDIPGEYENLFGGVSETFSAETIGLTANDMTRLYGVQSSARADSFVAGFDAGAAVAKAEAPFTGWYNPETAGKDIDVGHGAMDIFAKAAARMAAGKSAAAGFADSMASGAGAGFADSMAANVSAGFTGGVAADTLFFGQKEVSEPEEEYTPAYMEESYEAPYESPFDTPYTGPEYGSPDYVAEELTDVQEEYLSDEEYYKQNYGSFGTQIYGSSFAEEASAYDDSAAGCTGPQAFAGGAYDEDFRNDDFDESAAGARAAESSFGQSFADGAFDVDEEPGEPAETREERFERLNRMFLETESDSEEDTGDEAGSGFTGSALEDADDQDGSYQNYQADENGYYSEMTEEQAQETAPVSQVGKSDIADDDTKLVIEAPVLMDQSIYYDDAGEDGKEPEEGDNPAGVALTDDSDDEIGEVLGTNEEEHEAAPAVDIPEYQKYIIEGYEMLGVRRFEDAFDSFSASIGIDRTNSSAYWGRLMADLRVVDDDELSMLPIEKLEDEYDFRMASRCGSKEENKHFANIASLCRGKLEAAGPDQLSAASYRRDFCDIISAIRNGVCFEGLTERMNSSIAGLRAKDSLRQEQVKKYCKATRNSKIGAFPVLLFVLLTIITFPFAERVFGFDIVSRFVDLSWLFDMIRIDDQILTIAVYALVGIDALLLLLIVVKLVIKIGAASTASSIKTLEAECVSLRRTIAEESGEAIERLNERYSLERTIPEELLKGPADVLKYVG